MSSTDASSFALDVRDLHETYHGSVKAVDGLNLSEGSGSIFGLLGPKDAGNCTTIKLLTTLSRPDSGEARIAGIDVSRELRRVRHSIGCVAQNSDIDDNCTRSRELDPARSLVRPGLAADFAAARFALGLCLVCHLAHYARFQSVSTLGLDKSRQ